MYAEPFILRQIYGLRNCSLDNIAGFPYRLNILRNEEYVDRVAEDLREDEEDVDKLAHEWRPPHPRAARVQEGGLRGVRVVQEGNVRPAGGSLAGGRHYYFCRNFASSWTSSSASMSPLNHENKYPNRYFIIAT